MAYEIIIQPIALDQLARLRVHDERRIIEEIEKQLTHQPTTPTRQKKTLDALSPAWWDVDLPVWQLRVGDYRVLYGVSDVEKVVYVAAVLNKGRKTTREIIK